MITPIWRKSSCSTGGTSETCVEVADLSGNIGLRDSKTVSAGHLSVAPGDFARLVERIKDSALDL